MKLLGSFLALALLNSALAEDISSGSIHVVPTLQWVEVMNLRELNLTSRVPRCSMEAGTKVSVIDSNKIQSYVSYQAKSRAKRIACPDGAKFYLQTKVLATFNVQSEKIARERKALDIQIQEILNGKSPIDEVGDLQVKDHFQARGALQHLQWAFIQSEADNQSTLFNPGDSCMMHSLGRVRILGFLSDKSQVVFRYESPQEQTFKQNCPHNSLLMCSVENFSRIVR